MSAFPEDIGGQWVQRGMTRVWVPDADDADSQRALRARALVAERYGRNEWWTKRPEAPVWDDSEVATARRRKALADAYMTLEGRETA